MSLKRLTHVRPEVTPEASVLETVRLMASAEIGAIAVKRGSKLAGIFTERDLMKRVVAEGRDPAATRVGDVMTSEVVAILDSTPVAKAAATMRARRMRHLVIVDDDGEYVGLLAQRHVLYDLTSELSLKVDDLAGYVMADSGGG
jgi:CBS domain-containing protein